MSNIETGDLNEYEKLYNEIRQLVHNIDSEDLGWGAPNVIEGHTTDIIDVLHSYPILDKALQQLELTMVHK